MGSSTECHSNNAKGEIYVPIPTVDYQSPPTGKRYWSISKCFSLLVTSLITTSILIYSLYMFAELSLGPKTPIIQINSFSISNFNVSNTKLAANWNTSFTIYNPNLAMEFSLERIDGVIFYKEDDALSMTSVGGFHLGSQEEKLVSMEYATAGWEGDQPIVEYPVLREIGKDQREGIVSFSMRLNLWANYRTSFFWWWSRSVAVNPYCLDLKVGVNEGRGNGSLIGTGPKECLLLMMLID